MYKAKLKAKKVRTTLGTAPDRTDPADQANRVDLSHLKKPIETSLFGLRQVLGLLETATQEVRDYISYECNLIYECRVCRTMFRSLANFILHKREYCKEKYRLSFNGDRDHDCRMSLNAPTRDDPMTNPTRICDNPQADGVKKSLSEVLSRLECKQKSDEIFQKIIHEDLSKEIDSRPRDEEKTESDEIALQDIGENLSGVFQTLIRDTPDDRELMKGEVMEIHSILGNDEVILGPDGKVVDPPRRANDQAFNLTCGVCKQYFSTKKTLSHHVKYKHNNTRVVYVCPENGCKGNIFANTWSVFRHLYKVHRKSSVQVRKLRAQIQASVIKRGLIEDDVVEDTGGPNRETLDEQNMQWMYNFEGDNDLQMCGGCGKRFERKAALNSHSQFCVKRLAVCNSAKENKPSDDDESTTPEKKHDGATCKPLVKSKVTGSRKRKLATARRKPDEAAEKIGRLSEPSEKSRGETSEREQPEEKLRKPEYVKERARAADEKIESVRKMYESITITEIPRTPDERNGSKIEKPFDEKAGSLRKPFESIKEQKMGVLTVEEKPRASDDNRKTNEPVAKPIVAKATSEKFKTTAEKARAGEKVKATRKLLETTATKDKHKTTDEKPATRKLTEPKEKSRSTDKNPETGKPASSDRPRHDPLEKVTIELLPVSEPAADVSDDVIYVDTVNAVCNIFEPETVLLEGEGSAEVAVAMLPPDFIVCLSDDEEVHAPKTLVTLETKAASYMDTSDVKCLPCNHRFKKHDALLKHMSSHFKWFQFQCSVCLFKSYDRKTLEGHVGKCHVSGRPDDGVVVELPAEDVVRHSVDFESLPSVEDETPQTYKRPASTKDPSIQKMIMEVIFGNVNNNGEGNNTRPVRNRVLAKKDDYVYDEDIKRLTGGLGKQVKMYAKKRRAGDDTKAQQKS